MLIVSHCMCVKISKKLPQIFVSHLNVLQTTTLRIQTCQQKSKFFIHAKFQDVKSWLQMRSTTFN